MPEENEINYARYCKFCKNKIQEPPHQLPPTKDELLQHVKKPIVSHSFGKEHCMIIQIFCILYSPVGIGLSLSGDVFEVVWMENLPPPESVHELITYDCRWLNFNASCQRKILSLEFADICKCHANCENGSCNNDSDTDDEEIKEWKFITLSWIYNIS